MNSENWREIERKFLVKGDFKPFALKSVVITQGYLSSVPERNVRVRLCGDRAWLTVKGLSRDGGISRFEWEKEISPEEARLLFPLCEPGIIEKRRYLVPVGSHVYEVDEFYGGNAGLILAEIELKRAGEPFVRPDWLGQEVSGDARYYNSYLAGHPYRKWKNEK